MAMTHLVLMGVSLTTKGLAIASALFGRIHHAGPLRSWPIISLVSPWYA